MSSDEARSKFGSLLAAGKPTILDRYRSGLLAMDIVIAADETTWSELATQANHIIVDCVTTLMTGEVTVAQGNIYPVHEMAAERSEWTIQPHNSIRAGAILFEVIMAELGALAPRVAGGEALLPIAAVALGKSIFDRLELGTRDYESYVLNQVALAVDTERSVFARDLHDRVGSSVCVALRRAEMLEVDCGPARVAAVSDALGDAMTELACVTDRLRKTAIRDGMHNAITDFVESMELSVPRVTVQVNGVEDWASAQVLDQSFLIVRECIRNALAHAHASWVAVTIDISPTDVTALIRDDGVGFDLAAVERRNGLDSMIERAELLAGRVGIVSGIRRGTQVSMRIPNLPIEP